MPDGFKRDPSTDSQCLTDVRAAVHARFATPALVFVLLLPPSNSPAVDSVFLVKWEPLCCTPQARLFQPTQSFVHIIMTLVLSPQ